MTSEGTTENGRLLERWFGRFLDAVLQRNPVDATFLGIHRYDGELPDRSPDADVNWSVRARDLIAALDAIPFDGLAEMDLFDRALARSFLESQGWETESRFRQAGNPAYHTSEAVFSIVALVRCHAEQQDAWAEMAGRRMSKIPEFLATARDRISNAPLVWTERAIRETEAAIVYFGRDIRMFAEECGIGHDEFFRHAKHAARAFEEHAIWLRSVLYERRIPYRPAGNELFDQYLRHVHFLPTEQTIEWWFDYAHAELIETTRDMHELARAIDWKRSAREQLGDLSRHHPTTAGYFDAFGRIWTHRRQQAIDADLVTWPDAVVEFRPIPRSDRAIAQAYRYPLYRCPPPFGLRATDHMYVPPCDQSMSSTAQNAVLRRIDNNRIDLEFAIRNAGLGRHVQSQHALGSKSRIGRIAGVEGASRFAWGCGSALVGGWACYATELMEEVGALTSAQRLAEAQERVRIAARAVADTAIHSGEFSIERAARFLRDEAAYPASMALEEAVDISMAPATRLMPLVGVASIDELRRQCEDREGPTFSLKSFHDRLLSYGAIPVTLIAASMLAVTPDK